MKEKNDEFNNENNNKKNNEENEEEEICKIPDFKENLEEEIKNKNFLDEIEKRKKVIEEEEARLGEEKGYLQNLQNKDISKIKGEENYKKLEKYVSEIKNKVNTKFIEIETKFKDLGGDEAFQKLIKKNGADPVFLSKRKILRSVKRRTKEYFGKLLHPRVMFNNKVFSNLFDTFKELIDNIIKNGKLLKNPNSWETERKFYRLAQACVRDNKNSCFYRFYRNALYRQGYLLFYNTARLISNVKIEYDLWRPDTGKYVVGVNSSANLYYKNRSSWNYGVVKCNFFYIEFNFGLFHFLLRPLKRISEIGSIIARGRDYHKIFDSNGREVPFWDMINISLVQISVGPVGINGIRFSLFDPIFFIMSLCFVTYLGFNSEHNGDSILVVLTQYRRVTLEKKEYWDDEVSINSRQEEVEEHWNVLNSVYPKVSKIKKILEKIGLLAPGAYNTFMNSFKLYCRNNILFNIFYPQGRADKTTVFCMSWRVFIALVRSLTTSAPKCFSNVGLPVDYRACIPMHEKKITETYYDGDKKFASDEKDIPFRGLCDMFFLSLALLVYSMIDSISIDLRWIIENESVRKYCAKLKRKVCRFSKTNIE